MMRLALKRTTLLVSIGLLFTLGVFSGVLVRADADKVVIYQHRECGCCNAWADHMEENGFVVDLRMVPQSQVELIRRELGIPAELNACHTAIVGDYGIEGHVPADVISDIIDNPLPIGGVAVAGMPLGSPGMKHGSQTEPYDIIAFNRDGSTRVLESRQQ